MLELLGEGRYGAGNQPLISQNKEDLERAKAMRRQLRKRRREERQVADLRQTQTNHLVFMRLNDDVELEFVVQRGNRHGAGKANVLKSFGKSVLQKSGFLG